MILTEPLDRPDPLLCPVCKTIVDEWTWDEPEQSWQFGADWWSDPLDPADDWGYTCSQTCYQIRFQEVTPCSPRTSKGCSCATPSTAPKT